MEFTLLWAALAGVGGLYLALWWMNKRDATICVRDLWEIALTAGVIGLVVGRLVAMIRGGVNPLAHPGDAILLRAGVDTAGAVLAALISGAWLARRDLAEQLDGLAPAVLAALAGWHAGCLFRDACLGTPSSFPWAWSQPGSNITRHPVELYAALLLLTLAVLIFRVRMHLPAGGVVAGLALAAAGFARLITEPLRPALFAGPVWWYGAGIVVGLAVVAWAYLQPWWSQSAPDPDPIL